MLAFGFLATSLVSWLTDIALNTVFGFIVSIACHIISGIIAYKLAKLVD